MRLLPGPEVEEEEVAAGAPQRWDAARPLLAAALAAPAVLAPLQMRWQRLRVKL